MTEAEIAASVAVTDDDDDDDDDERTRRRCLKLLLSYLKPVMRVTFCLSGLNSLVTSVCRNVTRSYVIAQCCH